MCAQPGRARQFRHEVHDLPQPFDRDNQHAFEQQYNVRMDGQTRVVCTVFFNACYSPLQLLELGHLGRGCHKARLWYVRDSSCCNIERFVCGVVVYSEGVGFFLCRALENCDACGGLRAGPQQHSESRGSRFGGEGRCSMCGNAVYTFFVLRNLGITDSTDCLFDAVWCCSGCRGCS